MIGIIGSELDWNIGELKREIEARGEGVTLVPMHQLVARVSLIPRVEWESLRIEEMKLLFVRGVPGGSAEQIFFRMDVLHRLENLGITVINPAVGIERCADKYYTCTLLEDAGIPTPKTVVTERVDEAMNAFDTMRDVVVKPLFGSQGLGVTRIQDKDSAYRLFRILEYGKLVFYIQEYLPHENEDFRAFVLGDRVIAAMKRKGNTWKTNISQGATAERVILPGNVAAMAVKASKVTGCMYAGVDIIPCEGKYYVVEVNSIPGWKGLQSVTEFCIAEKIVSHFL